MSIDSTPLTPVESKPGPEVIIAGYMFSAVSLGAQFGASPYPNYVRDTVRVLVRDLAEHGYLIAPVNGGRA